MGKVWQVAQEHPSHRSRGGRRPFVDRLRLTVADVFRRDGDVYRDLAAPSLSTAQRRVMTAIEQCRTAVLGGHVEQCDQCGHTRVWYA